MIHKQQKTDFGCVFASLAMVLGGDESYYFQAINGSEIDGTTALEVSKYLTKSNIEHLLVGINDNIDNLWWLEPQSTRYPIIVCGVFKHKTASGIGRPRERHHAFVINERKIFDPSEKFVLDFGAKYGYKKLIIDHIIIVLNENNNYGKGMINHEY